jgi:hypothetical protein
LLRALGQAQELKAELIVIIDDLERSDVAPFCIAVHSSPVRILSHVPSCTELHFFSALRFAVREPAAARKDLFLSLPSAYPFSAQARLEPRWDNLWSRLTAFDLSQRHPSALRMGRLRAS